MPASNVLLFLWLVVLAFSTAAQPRPQGLFIPPDYFGSSESPSTYYYPNRGQLQAVDGSAADGVSYYAGSSNQALFISDDRFSFSVSDVPANDTILRIDALPLGSEAGLAYPIVLGNGRDYENFFSYHLPPGGITHVYGSRRLAYKDLWPKIDLHFASNQFGRCAYIVVNPGGDPSDIAFKLEGQDSLQLLPQALKMFVGNRNLSITHPIAYQVNAANGIENLPWQPAFVLAAPNIVEIAPGDFDGTHPLIYWIGLPGAIAASAPFDPGNLEWSGYYGDAGSGDVWGDFEDLQIDQDGNQYYVSSAFDAQFPTTQGLTPTFGPASNIVLVKFDTLQQRQWATHYSALDDLTWPNLALDPSDKPHLLFNVSTNSVPQVANPPPSAFMDTTYAGNGDAMLAQLSSDGDVLIWQTFIGGSSAYELAENLTIDAFGNIYTSIRGADASSPTIILPGAYNDNVGDLLISRFDPNYQFDWSTRFGSSGNPRIFDMVCDNLGNLFLGGVVTPTNFDIVNPGFDAYVDSTAGTSNLSGFITKFDAASLQIDWATWFGPPGSEIRGMTTNGKKLFVTGQCERLDYPLVEAQSDSIVYAASSGNGMFVAEFDNLHNLAWSHHEQIAGGFGTTVAVHPQKNVVIVGGGDNGTGPDYQTFHAPGYFHEDINVAHEMTFTAWDQDRLRVWGTLFGGDSHEVVRGVAIHNDWLFAAGRVQSTNSSFHLVQLPGAFNHSSHIDPTSPSAWYARFNIAGLDTLHGDTISVPDTSSLHIDQFLPPFASVFPNPTSGRVQVKCTINCKIRIFNVSGNEIPKTAVRSDDGYWLDLTNQPNGIYVVRIACDNYTNHYKLVKYR